jgi:hypothetical protein
MTTTKRIALFLVAPGGMMIITAVAAILVTDDMYALRAVVCWLACLLSYYIGRMAELLECKDRTDALVDAMCPPEDAQEDDQKDENT